MNVADLIDYLKACTPGSPVIFMDAETEKEVPIKAVLETSNAPSAMAVGVPVVLLSAVQEERERIIQEVWKIGKSHSGGYLAMADKIVEAIKQEKES